ncbi:GNAT family N-acetyltransferase [Ulvibacterium sp.]|uniref:GNAT family N-acetyltransferase n=1 Tax=Ulvibacterium sp. TaxID=2665914 RepID=UPI00260329EB|nr:GNAT family N-acetyltransferase [Ulvibacterium sp.]
MGLLLNGEETKRLGFRNIMPADFEAWLPFHEDPRSTQYWEGLPQNPRIACQEQFDRVFERYEKKLGGMNALIRKSDGNLVGICGLLVQFVDGLKELEIGYSILPKYWKQGYATEAATKCRQYAFENNLADSLISIIHVDNVPSQKVALNNGMHLDKTTFYKDNPVHVFRILSPLL